MAQIRELFEEETAKLKDPVYMGGGWDVPYGPSLLDLPMDKVLTLPREAYSEMLDAYLKLHDEDRLANDQ